jgi:hypothetical protein
MNPIMLRKLIFTTMLLVMAHWMMAQNARFQLRETGEEVKARIMGYSERMVFTSNGNFMIAEIISVNFESRDAVYANLYDILQNAGVSIIFQEGVAGERSNLNPESIAQRANPAEVSSKTVHQFRQQQKFEQIQQQMHAFREQRKLGFYLQFVGIGLVAVSGAVLLPELAIAGGVASLIGLAIQADAGKHLHFDLGD